MALITFTTSEDLAAYNHRRNLKFPTLTDPSRSVYATYGLGHASLQRVWGLRSLRRYGEIIGRRGFADLRKPTENTRQLGGDFVIDPDGILRFGFWAKGPDDRPKVDSLLEAVAEFS